MAGDREGRHLIQRGKSSIGRVSQRTPKCPPSSNAPGPGATCSATKVAMLTGFAIRCAMSVRSLSFPAGETASAQSAMTKTDTALVTLSGTPCAALVAQDAHSPRHYGQHSVEVQPRKPIEHDYVLHRQRRKIGTCSADSTTGGSSTRVTTDARIFSCRPSEP